MLMSKFSRIVVLVTALASLFAVMSSTAGATTFTNTGGTSFHAVGGAATLTPTRHPGVGSNLTCLTSTWTGTLSAGAFTSVTGTATSSSCSLSGNPAHIGCTYTLTPVAWTNATQAITSGSAAVTCTMSVGGVPLCHIEGNTPGHYFNPDPPNTVGRLTLTASSSLQVTHSNGASSCSALLGTTPSGPGHLTEHTINLTGPASSNPFVTSP
jgi:hypothetical protein